VSKITLSVCKVYKNTGRFRFHRKKTKPSWKHYFLSDDYTDEYTFGTEWISNIKAMILKRNVYKIRKYICLECGNYFPAAIRRESDSAECPNCPEDE